MDQPVTGTFRAARVVSRWLWAVALTVLAWTNTARAGDADWTAAFRAMPLSEPVQEINETNFANVMLESFQSNTVVKAFILMPGATDEFYFFHRAITKLGPQDTNLFAAIHTLTNKTRIQATYQAPFLILHTAEDPLTVGVTIKDAEMAARLKVEPFLPHCVYNDRDWDYLRPILSKHLNIYMFPQQRSPDSWHFYRHSFAGWNLTGWEALQATAMAGKSVFTVEKSFFRRRPLLTYEPDDRGTKR